MLRGILDFGLADNCGDYKNVRFASLARLSRYRRDPTAAARLGLDTVVSYVVSYIVLLSLLLFFLIYHVLSAFFLLEVIHLTRQSLIQGSLDQQS